MSLMLDVFLYPTVEVTTTPQNFGAAIAPERPFGITDRVMLMHKVNL
jgi:hypothetical protein